ncbi:hypothetical protein [Streptomyces sp. WMMC905]|uniref:hypothetical protein n=1 Tax=Streptomyces sp. WMMC905 TaxID=3404123 RepID=UPI003B9358CB
MNLAKDSSSWERTVSVTPLPDSVRRKAALQVAARAVGLTNAVTFWNTWGCVIQRCAEWPHD